MKPKNKSIFSQFKRNKTEVIIFVLIVLLAAFLRLYKIREFVVFLGDEGRDALVVKQIVFDHKLTLLGPTASVGGFYLGPIYYYFMIPWMILFNMDPVGPAVMVAFMGITTVVLLYFVLRDWFGKQQAMISSLIYAVSPGIVNFSRSSWNPNPMPLFSLIAVASLYYSITKKKPLLAFIAGTAFGVAVQLHYLGLIIGLILAAITFVLVGFKKAIKLGLIQFAGFFIGASLYFAFEIRHGFPNIRSVLEFVGRIGSTTGPRSFNPITLFMETSRFNIESILSNNLSYITKPTNQLLFFLTIFFIYTLISKKNKITPAIKTVLTYWIVGILGIGMYKGQLHFHYFEFLFPVPFLLLGMSLNAFSSKTAKLLLSSAFLLFAIFLVSKQTIWGQGSNLIDQTKFVSQEVLNLAEKKPFNFALITGGNSDHAYRFFLELDGAKPKPLTEEITSQLLVVCELELDQCEPLGHPLWEIAGFGRAEIDRVETIQSNIHIFRLIHHPESQNLIGTQAKQG